jgi:hypothetical protein
VELREKCYIVLLINFSVYNSTSYQPTFKRVSRVSRVSTTLIWVERLHHLGTMPYETVTTGCACTTGKTDSTAEINIVRHYIYICHKQILSKQEQEQKHWVSRSSLSTRKHKKLDVYKHGEKIASIGDTRYSDFLQHGDEGRRRLYKKRHEKDRHKKGSPGFYADKILW